MADAINPITALLEFTHNWYLEESWADQEVGPNFLFPTFENQEDQVRWDLQYHPETIKRYLNEQLIPFINSLVSAVNDMVEASVPDGSITNAKLSSTATPGGPAVATNNLADRSVTYDKLSRITDTDGAAVGSDAIRANAVIYGKIAGSAVGESQLRSNSVSTTRIQDAAVTNAKLGNDIIPESVGFVVGTGDPTENEGLLAVNQVYLKLES